MSNHVNYWGKIRIKNPRTLQSWIDKGWYGGMLRQGYVFAPHCGRFRPEKCTCTKCRRQKGGNKLVDLQEKLEGVIR